MWYLVYGQTCAPCCLVSRRVFSRKWHITYGNVFPKCNETSGFVIDIFVQWYYEACNWLDCLFIDKGVCIVVFCKGVFVIWPINSNHSEIVNNIELFFYLCVVIYRNEEGTCCRIWSWSPVLCEKHGPRDSVDKNRGRRPRFLSLLRPEGHVFQTARETMIKSYYSTLADWFFSCFMHINMNFSALKWALLAQFMVARESALLLWTCCQRTQMNNCHENLNTCVNELNGI